MSRKPLLARGPRNPPPADSAAIERFVATGRASETSDAQVAGRSDTEAAERSKPPKGKGWVWRDGRGNDPGHWVRRLTAYLEPELDRRLRRHALDEEADLSDVLNDALRRYLDASGAER